MVAHRLAQAAVLLALFTSACGEETSTTGVTLTISILTREFTIDELRVRAEIPGEPAREVRRKLDEPAGDSETVNLLFDSSSGGRDLTLIVEAFSQGASVLTGRTTKRLERDKYITAEVRLLACAAPDGPFCDADTLVDCDPDKVRTIRTTCEFGCNAEATRCNQCEPNTGACNGDSYVSCGGDGLPLFEESCVDNGDPCRTGVCTPNGCITAPANEGMACDDGRYCVEDTTCTQGTCGGGTPRNCDDGNACTFDICDEAADMCDADASPNEGLPCQGTAYCVVQTTCSAGACGGGTARDCDDDNPCTLDGCDEASDSCTQTDKGDGTPCEDGAFCTLGDRCASGSCAPGVASPCADANPCTADACDEDNDACSTSFVGASTTCLDANTATTCDGAGRATNTLCPYGCNGTRNECNECDPDPNKVVTCRADVENLCNAQFICNPQGLVVFKTCCASNQCTCDGLQCLEDTCSAAPDVSGGGSFTGDLCSGSDNVPGDCNPGGVACQSVASGGTPERFYRLTLDDQNPRSTFYNVVLDASGSAAATDLRLSTVCGNESLQVPNAEVCALPVGVGVQRACLKEDGSDVMLLCGLPEGDYFSAIEAEAGACTSCPCNYDLDVTVTPATLDTAAQAGNISRGGRFRGNTCGMADNFSFPNTANINGCDGVGNCAGGICPSCSAGAATDCRVTSQDSLCSFSGAGAPDAIFYLALPVDSGVDISTAGSLYDTVLYLMKAGPSGATPPGEVRICNDDCFSANGASHIQTSLPAGLYFVVLDGAGTDCGDFVLDVTVSPAATCPNLSCEAPLENCETCPGDCRCQLCGDGSVQGDDGEQCDDDGTSGGDGCSALCVVEPGYKCTGEPSTCELACGDGIVDRDRGEECDDGNTLNTDGCSATCTVESGFICSGAPSVCAPGVRVSNCPNAPIPDTGPVLSSTINVPNVFTLSNVTVDLEVEHTWIGDLVIELRSPNGTSVFLHNGTGGSADNIIGNYDGTLLPDGPGTMDSFNGGPANGTWTLRANDTVTVDSGTLKCWTLNLVPQAVAGNGQCEAPQENCVNTPADCPCTNCGNGLVQFSQGEQCDDDGNADSDGCSSQCQVEAGYKCNGAPSVCVRTCGDGVLDAGEGCDDGNAATPGCSATCQTEVGYICEGEPSVCVRGVRVSACPQVAIPDNNNTGVSSTLNVPLASCSIANVTVDVDIAHTYIGDLIVDLLPPVGALFLLHNRGGSSLDNIIGNYDQTLLPADPDALGMDTFNGDAANGNWRLRARDRAAQDTGSLRCWGVNIYCQ